MNKIEYKTILLPYKPSVFQADDTEMCQVLNKESEHGWRLSQIVLPSAIWGRSNGMIAILERHKS